VNSPDPSVGAEAHALLLMVAVVSIIGGGIGALIMWALLGLGS